LAMDPKIDLIAIKRENKRIAKIQKGQRVFSALRPIKKFAQLVQQSNNCFLYPSQAIQGHLITSFALAEFSNNPIKTIFIKDNSRIISFLGKNYSGQPRKLDFQAIQKINHTFINSEGFSYGWYYIFEQFLFDFINLKDKQNLQKFITKTGFSVFPNIAEFQSLLSKYEQAGIVGVPSFRVTNDGTLPVIWKEEKNKDREKIEEINLNFLWNKKEKLFDYVRKYEVNELVMNDLLFINEQMENISDALMDTDAFHKKDIANRSIENQSKDTRNLEETIGNKKVKDTGLLVHYRIYGHFAACCFELFLKIMEKQRIAVCANSVCQRYFSPKRNGQEYCGHKECDRTRGAQRGKKAANKEKK